MSSKKHIQSNTDLEIIPKKSPVKSHHIIEFGISIILLVLLVLLSGNIYVIFLAKQYNELACRDALNAAVKAFNSGAEICGIMQAAQDSLTAYGAISKLFIEHPQFTKFKYEKLPSARAFIVETTTAVHLPAPWLLVDKEALQDGKLNVSKTYVLQMKNIGKKKEN